MNDWRPTEEAPLDGTPVYGRIVRVYRWKPYKTGAPAELLRKGGRWQVSNGRGGWENVPEGEEPEDWRPVR